MTVRAVAARIAFLSALLAAPVAVSSATAQEFNPLRDATADGTWDCVASDGTAIGAVVIVERAYAFINPDSKVAGYGKIHRVSEGLVDLPNFLVLTGPLKDDHGIVAIAEHGPANDTENYSGALILDMADVNSKYTECTRRLIEGRRQ
jgi:hypothetical protein